MPRHFLSRAKGIGAGLALAGLAAQGIASEPAGPVSTLSLIHRARIAMAASNHLAALDFAQRAVDVDPAYAEAWKQLGRVAMLQGRLQVARDAFETAIELQPGDPDLARWQPALFRDLGWANIAAGDWEQAVRWFHQALAAPLPRRDALLRGAFTALAESPRAELAAPFLERWADAHAARALAEDLLLAGRWQAAEQAWAAAWREPALRPHLAPRLLFARILNDTIRCDDARTLLDALRNGGVSLSPEDRDMAHEGLLPCKEELDGRMLDAWDALAGDPTPSVTDHLERAARRHLAARKYGLAALLFQRVFHRDPNRRSFIRAASAREALRGRADALDFINRLATRCTEPAVRIGAEGYAAQLGGDAAAAAVRYAESLALDPSQPDVRRELFSVLLHLGRTNDARAQLDWFADRLQSGDESARAPIAEMWSALGRDDEALRFWSELVRSYPASPYFAVERARTLLRMGRRQEALDGLLDLTQRIGDAQAYELMAAIYLDQNQAPQALEAIERGLDLEYTPALLGLRARIADAPPSNGE